MAKAAFAPDPRRRALLGKVHVAKKQLGLVDDDYRQIVADVTGRTSAGDCTEAELVRLVERLKSRGFQTLPTRPATGPKPADHPVARKARALWISLYQLGAVEQSGEAALEAFARRQLGCDRMQWADQAKGYKLIEALKEIGARHGWDQSIAGIPVAQRVYALRLRHVEAILAKLKRLCIVPKSWSIAQAAWHLCGVPNGSDETIWAVTQLDVIAAGLGAKLRQAQGKQG